jgi:hypothetical protein
MRMLELQGYTLRVSRRENSGKPDVLVNEDVDEWLSGPRRRATWVDEVG